MSNPADNLQSNINPRELWVLNFFWLGFILYTSAFTMIMSEQMNFKIWFSLQIMGLLILLPAVFLLIKFKFDNKFLQIIFSIYYLWLIVVVIRGFSINSDFIRKLFFNAYEGGIIFLAPIVLLFPRKLFYLKKSINVILILGVIYTCYSLYFIRELLIPYNSTSSSQAIVEYFSKTLSIPCGFILLTYIYHSNKKNFLALFVTLLTAFFALYRARRALMLMAMLPLIVAYIVYLNYHKGYILKIVIFILLASILALFVANWNSTLYNLKKNDTTGWFLARIDEKTRSLVEEYFYRDMKPIDWVIGKGINGKYYCPGVIDGPTYGIYRYGIETDYLTIILKGGIISLGLFLIIALTAIIKGLFHSKNLLSKAAAVWIIFYLFNLYPAPVTTFSMNYLLVWISIGICFSGELRNMPDDSIKEVFSG